MLFYRYNQDWVSQKYSF